jgi:hypothetical protein
MLVVIVKGAIGSCLSNLLGPKKKSLHLNYLSHTICPLERMTLSENPSHRRMFLIFL